MEEFQIDGTVKGSVVHAQRIRTVSITAEGVLTASGWGLFSSLPFNDLLFHRLRDTLKFSMIC